MSLTPPPGRTFIVGVLLDDCRVHFLLNKLLGQLWTSLPKLRKVTAANDD